MRCCQRRRTSWGRGWTRRRRGCSSKTTTCGHRGQEPRADSVGAQILTCGSDLASGVGPSSAPSRAAAKSERSAVPAETTAPAPTQARSTPRPRAPSTRLTRANEDVATCQCVQLEPMRTWLRANAVNCPPGGHKQPRRTHAKVNRRRAAPGGRQRIQPAHDSPRRSWQGGRPVGRRAERQLSDAERRGGAGRAVGEKRKDVPSGPPGGKEAT